MTFFDPNILPAAEIESFRVVAIGGGTGLSTLLKGLKRYVPAAGQLFAELGREDGVVIGDLAAVVTVTDDGGSSGLLRREFNILPPGDIRNCIVALSEDEALMSRLFQFRFPPESQLQGHSFGNLFLLALTGLTQDFAAAVQLGSDILATRGRIFPSTTANVNLEAVMNDGSRVYGETNINASDKRIVELSVVPADAAPLPQTLDAIARADLVTIGPGSLFTSLVPNLLVHGIPEAIRQSHALKVFVCNLMTEANESIGLSAAGHIRALFQHAGRKVFDHALLNSRPVSVEMQRKYAAEAAEQIAVDVAAVRALGVEPILGDYLDESGYARHATDRVARDLLMLAKRHRAAHARQPAPLNA
jgi:uncharacterized cofD-like protein